MSSFVTIQSPMRYMQAIPNPDYVEVTPFEIARYYTQGPDTTEPMPVRHRSHLFEMTEAVVGDRVFTTLDAVEDHYLNFSETVGNYEVYGSFEPRKSQTWIGGSPLSIAVLINRLSNLVAARSRIAVGNVALIHDGHIDMLNESHHLRQITPGEMPQLGRWSPHWMLNSSTIIYSGTAIAPNRLACLYAGPSDRGSLLATEVGGGFAIPAEFDTKPNPAIHSALFEVYDPND